MALRVLLADESSTIKKVFQLALQDFAVDVRPVNIGLDVVKVAQSFNPDIIFADVLLQKKNGYEVALEVKNHPELKGVPVVLMWSGFMEFDDDKFQASLANAQLEKPFDVAALRKLVTDLVPRTQNQRISQFLSFPQMPEMQEKIAASANEPPPPPEEDFQQVPIAKMKSAQNEKFRLTLKAEELESSDLPVDFASPQDAKAPDEDEEFSFGGEATKIKFTQSPANIPEPGDLELDEEDTFHQSPPKRQTAMPAKRPPAPAPPVTAAPQLNEEQLEEIIRAQSAEMIESVVWKVVPELAKQIIERELNRLLKERDSQL